MRWKRRCPSPLLHSKFHYLFSAVNDQLPATLQNQIRRHIQGYQNFSTRQSAYRVFHSMETAVTRVVNDLLAASDKKTSSLLLFDIISAFDTLDHYRLIEHAKNLFGLDYLLLEWLRSYLTSHTQYVGGCRFVAAAMTSGVPQDSVFGPLLFSMFTLLRSEHWSTPSK